MAKVTFLRHAETKYNVDKIFCGIIDCDITENGKLECITHNGFLRNFCNLFNLPHISKNLDFFTVDSSIVKNLK